jgi:sugar O-acyltransferase (sialic acid O-acetyltransferase NeuD family)
VDRPALLLVGAGGHARACIDVVEQEARYAVAGLVGLASEVGSKVCGYPVLGTDDDLPQLMERHRLALISIGQIKTAELRERVFALVERKGGVPSPIVSPRAYVSRYAQVGAGTIIMHGAIVNAGARVGRNCIINSLALVEHDTVIGDHCHVATSAALNSGVHVGDGSFIGSGATVRQSTRIGARCVIGMGQTVLRDCEPGTWLPRQAKPS